MKNHPLFTLPIAVVPLLLFSCPLAKADDEADRVALRRIKAAYEEAVSTGNPSKIAPYLSDGITGVMVTGEPIQNFQSLEAYWTKVKSMIGDGGTYQVKVTTDKTDLYGNLSVSRGTTEDVVHLANGKEFKFNSLWTAVCHKEAGVWKVVRMQATMDPVNNPFITARIRMTQIISGAVGFVAGVMVLLVIRMVCKTKRSKSASER